MEAQIILSPSSNWYGSHVTSRIPNSTILAVCAHNSILLLDTLTGTIKGVLSGHTNRTTAVVCGQQHNDNNSEAVTIVVSAGADRTVRVWRVQEEDGGDKATGNLVRLWPRRPADVKSLALNSSATTLLIGDVAGNIAIANLTDNTSKLIKLHRCKSRDAITCIAISPNDSRPLAAIGYTNGYFDVIDYESDAVVGSFHIHNPKYDVQRILWTSVPLNSKKHNQKTIGEACSNNSNVELLISCAGDSIAVYNHQYQLWDGFFHDKSPDAPPPPPPPPPPNEPEEAAIDDMNSIPSGPEYPSCDDLFEVLHVFETPDPPSSTSGGGGHAAGGHKSRKWLTTAIIPHIYGGNSSSCLTASKPEGFSSSTGFFWMLSSGHAGSLLAWKIPLQMTEDIVGPFKFSPGHTRTIFSIDTTVPSIANSSADSLDIAGNDNNNKNRLEQSSVDVPFRIVTTSMDRSIGGWSIPSACLTSDCSNPKQWHKASLDWTISGLGGHAYALSLQRIQPAENTNSSETTSLEAGGAVKNESRHEHQASNACLMVAVGSGDKTIRCLDISPPSCDQPKAPVEVVVVNKQQVLWHGITEKVTCVSWHPEETSILAYGCEDGTLGLISSGKQASVILPVKHKGIIRGLYWVSSEPSDDNKPSFKLYSYSSDGAVLEWPVWTDIPDLLCTNSKLAQQRSAQATTTSKSGGGSRLSVEQLGKPTSIMKNVTSMCCSNGFLAYSTHNNAPAGGVCVHMCCTDMSDQQQKRKDGTVATIFTAAGVDKPATLISLDSTARALAVCWEGHSVVGVVTMYDNSLGNTTNGSFTMVEVAGIPTSLASFVGLSSSQHGLIGFVACGLSDGTIQIIGPLAANGNNHQQSNAPSVLMTLKGHTAPVLSLAWNQHETVDNSNGVGRTDLVLFSGSEDASVLSWTLSIDQLVHLSTSQAIEEETAAATDQSALQTVDGAMVLTKNEVENEQSSSLASSQQPGSSKSKKSASATNAASKGSASESCLGSAAILPDSSFTAVQNLSSSSQTLLTDACLTLAQHFLASPASASSSSLKYISGPSEDVKRAGALLDCHPEQQSAGEALQGVSTSLTTAAAAAGKLQRAQRAAAVALWSGDVAEGIRVLVENDALTADFVSMSAAAGRPAWEAVVRLHAANLEAKNEPHLAALHLASIEDIHGAVAVYTRANALREALALASARLPPEDPVLRGLHSTIADQLMASGGEKGGQTSQRVRAAGHYIAAGQWIQAIRALYTERPTHHTLPSALKLARMVLTKTSVVNVDELLQVIEELEAVVSGTQGGPLPSLSVASEEEKQEIAAQKELQRMRLPAMPAVSMDLSRDDREAVEIMMLSEKINGGSQLASATVVNLKQPDFVTARLQKEGRRVYTRDELLAMKDAGGDVSGVLLLSGLLQK